MANGHGTSTFDIRHGTDGTDDDAEMADGHNVAGCRMPDAGAVGSWQLLVPLVPVANIGLIFIITSKGSC
jgi:hypothetical protein